MSPFIFFVTFFFATLPPKENAKKGLRDAPWTKGLHVSYHGPRNASRFFTKRMRKRQKDERAHAKTKNECSRCGPGARIQSRATPETRPENAYSACV